MLARFISFSCSKRKQLWLLCLQHDEDWKMISLLRASQCNNCQWAGTWGTWKLLFKLGWRISWKQGTLRSITINLGEIESILAAPTAPDYSSQTMVNLSAGYRFPNRESYSKGDCLHENLRVFWCNQERHWCVQNSRLGWNDPLGNQCTIDRQQRSSSAMRTNNEPAKSSSQQKRRKTLQYLWMATGREHNAPKCWRRLVTKKESCTCPHCSNCHSAKVARPQKKEVCARLHNLDRRIETWMIFRQAGYTETLDMDVRISADNSDWHHRARLLGFHLGALTCVLWLGKRSVWIFLRRNGMSHVFELTCLPDKWVRIISFSTQYHLVPVCAIIWLLKNICIIKLDRISELYSLGSIDLTP